MTNCIFSLFEIVPVCLFLNARVFFNLPASLCVNYVVPMPVRNATMKSELFSLRVAVDVSKCLTEIQSHLVQGILINQFNEKEKRKRKTRKKVEGNKLKSILFVLCIN